MNRMFSIVLQLLWGAWRFACRPMVLLIGIKPHPAPQKKVVTQRVRNVQAPVSQHVAKPKQPRSSPQEAVQPTLQRQFWVSSADAIAATSQEQQFRQQFCSLGYDSYGPALNELRSSQFPQLTGVTYLDHAAATLYSVQQLLAANQELAQHLFANPHSQLGGALDRTPAAIDELRLLTLKMLNAPADEYDVSCSKHHTCAWSSLYVCCVTAERAFTSLRWRCQHTAAGMHTYSFCKQVCWRSRLLHLCADCRLLHLCGDCTLLKWVSHTALGRCCCCCGRGLSFLGVWPHWNVFYVAMCACTWLLTTSFSKPSHQEGSKPQPQQLAHPEPYCTLIP